VVPLLAAAGLTVVAPDLRWHGDSAAGSPAGGPSHVARLGADLAELLAACAETNQAAPARVVLVGSSMGAAVAWSYLECFGQARVAGMCAVDQAPLQNRAPGWALGSKGCFDAPSLARLQAALAADMPAFADGNAACCLAAPLADAALSALLKAETLRCEPERLGALMADHTSRDWRPLLPLLRCPVLSVFGTASGVFPAEGCAAVGDAAPNGRNLPFPGANHWLYLEQPAAFADAIAAFAAQCFA
jgi:non-heme chloroperoxidase